jgi:hypothetical protein
VLPRCVLVQILELIDWKQSFKYMKLVNIICRPNKEPLNIAAYGVGEGWRRSVGPIM